jgi:hypothetical protein
MEPLIQQNEPVVLKSNRDLIANNIPIEYLIIIIGISKINEETSSERKRRGRAVSSIFMPCNICCNFINY